MNTIALNLEFDPAISGEVSAKLKPFAAGDIIVVEADNLDGSATVIQLIQVLSSLATAVTPIVLHYLNQGKLKKIRVGDVEIENPTPEQWKQLWEQQATKTKRD